MNEEGNPNISQIDAYWERLIPLLNNLAGTKAGELLRDVKETDKNIFNALYWRTDRWMKLRISKNALTKGEQQYGSDDIGSIRLAAFVQGRKSGDWWETFDLGQMLSQIDGWSDELPIYNTEPAGPPDTNMLSCPWEENNA